MLKKNTEWCRNINFFFIFCRVFWTSICFIRRKLLTVLRKQKYSVSIELSNDEMINELVDQEVMRLKESGRSRNPSASDEIHCE